MTISQFFEKSDQAQWVILWFLNQHSRLVSKFVSHDGRKKEIKRDDSLLVFITFFLNLICGCIPTAIMSSYVTRSALWSEKGKSILLDLSNLALHYHPLAFGFQITDLVYCWKLKLCCTVARAIKSVSGSFSFWPCNISRQICLFILHIPLLGILLIFMWTVNKLYRCFFGRTHN